LSGDRPAAYGDFKDALITQWPAVRDVMRTRRTQTNEAGPARARAEPPRIVAGDLNDRVAGLADAPRDATSVIFHSAVLNYLSPVARAAFGETVREIGARWIADESDPSADGRFVVSVDGAPVAHAAPHGHTLRWLTHGTGRTPPGTPRP
jgi:hypothetical protein